MTRSSPASRLRLPPFADCTARPSQDEQARHLLLEAVRTGGQLLGSVILEVAGRLPPDLAHVKPLTIARHLLWIATAATGGRHSSADGEHGGVLVLRRRLLDLLQSELIRSWEAHPVRGDVMLTALRGLDTVRRELAPQPQQEFASELGDASGLDLVVEIAHDMRSPLTSILFLAEMLHKGQSGPLNDVQRRQIGVVYSAALALVGLTGDMMEMARGSDQLATRRPVVMSVNEILTSVRDLVQPIAEEKGLELRIRQLDSDNRIGYPVPLSRILLNLTTNALKFTQSGYVEIAAVPARDTRVEFSVRDTGPGISEAGFDSMYHPFRREPERESGYSFSGTGLGLSMCRRLASALGSSLEVETRAGWGTRFSFCVDIPPADLL